MCSIDYFPDNYGHFCGTITLSHYMCSEFLSSMQGRSQRCFKGHSGPVLSLADTLLGDSGSKILASGGEDCTVRLWSLNPSGKKHPLVSTYHGHEKPLSFLTVAGYQSLSHLFPSAHIFDVVMFKLRPVCSKAI